MSHAFVVVLCHDHLHLRASTRCTIGCCRRRHTCWGIHIPLFKEALANCLLGCFALFSVPLDQVVWWSHGGYKVLPCLGHSHSRRVHAHSKYLGLHMVMSIDSVRQHESHKSFWAILRLFETWVPGYSMGHITFLIKMLRGKVRVSIVAIILKVQSG